MEAYTLSASETIIMKAIWDSNGKRISTCDLLAILREKYRKDYARTTVTTFLQKLSYKGFVRCNREGKFSYIESLIEEQEYVTKLMNGQIDFWYDGKVADAVAVLIEKQKDKNEDLTPIIRLLEEKVNSK